MRRTAKLQVLVLVLATLTLPSRAEAALPEITPTCGVPITQSGRLGADLPCPATDGIVIGADGITIDLNGFKVSGGGSFDGIRNSDEFKGVTVRNGVVDGFGIGVSVFGNKNTLRELSVLDSSNDGISIRGFDSLVADSLVSSPTDDGIVVSRGGVTVADNIVRRAGDVGINVTAQVFTEPPTTIRRNLIEFSGDISIFASGFSKVLVVGNTIVGSGDSVGVDQEDAIRLDPTGTIHTIRSNEISFTSGDGIDVDGSAVIVGNIVSNGNENGIEAFATDPGGLIQGNRVTGNSEDGVDADGPYRVIENVARTNGDHGIDLHGNDGLVKRNRAIANDSDGIIIDGSGQKIIENVANSNGFPNGNADGNGLGIDATGGTSFIAKRNSARSNDAVSQCLPTGVCA